MAKKIILYSLGLVLIFLIEAVIRPITVFGVAPMYVLCGISAIGILEKEKLAAIFGLIFGLFCDFTGGALFGSQALTFMITGLVAGLLSVAIIGIAYTYIAGKVSEIMLIDMMYMKLIVYLLNII